MSKTKITLSESATDVYCRMRRGETIVIGTGGLFWCDGKGLTGSLNESEREGLRELQSHDLIERCT